MTSRPASSRRRQSSPLPGPSAAVILAVGLGLTAVVWGLGQWATSRGNRAGQPNGVTDRPIVSFEPIVPDSTTPEPAHEGRTPDGYLSATLADELITLVP